MSKTKDLVNKTFDPEGVASDVISDILDNASGAVFVNGKTKKGKFDKKTQTVSGLENAVEIVETKGIYYALGTSDVNAYYFNENLYDANFTVASGIAAGVFNNYGTGMDLTFARGAATTKIYAYGQNVTLFDTKAGDVFAAGYNKFDKKNPAAIEAVEGDSTITVMNSTVSNIYAGGEGDASYKGNVTVEVYNSKVGKIYAGGKGGAYTQGDVTVIVSNNGNKNANGTNMVFSGAVFGAAADKNSMSWGTTSVVVTDYKGTYKGAFNYVDTVMVSGDSDVTFTGAFKEVGTIAVAGGATATVNKQGAYAYELVLTSDTLANSASAMLTVGKAVKAIDKVVVTVNDDYVANGAVNLLSWAGYTPKKGETAVVPNFSVMNENGGYDGNGGVVADYMYSFSFDAKNNLVMEYTGEAYVLSGGWGAAATVSTFGGADDKVVVTNSYNYDSVILNLGAGANEVDIRNANAANGAFSMDVTKNKAKNTVNAKGFANDVVINDYTNGDTKAEVVVDNVTGNVDFNNSKDATLFVEGAYTGNVDFTSVRNEAVVKLENGASMNANQVDAGANDVKIVVDSFNTATFNGLDVKHYIHQKNDDNFTDFDLELGKNAVLVSDNENIVKDYSKNIDSAADAVYNVLGNMSSDVLVENGKFTVNNYGVVSGEIELTNAAGSVQLNNYGKFNGTLDMGAFDKGDKILNQSIANTDLGAAELGGEIALGGGDDTIELDGDTKLTADITKYSGTKLTIDIKNGTTVYDGSIAYTMSGIYDDERMEADEEATAAGIKATEVKITNAKFEVAEGNELVVNKVTLNNAEVTGEFDAAEIEIAGNATLNSDEVFSGDLTVGAVLNAQNLEAENVTVNAAGKINSKDLTARETLTVVAPAVVNADAVAAKNANIGGTVNADSLTVAEALTVTGAGNVTAEGDVTAASINNDGFDGKISAANIVANEGNIQLNEAVAAGNITADNGLVTIINATAAGNVTAKGNIGLNTADVEGNVVSAEGDVTLGNADVEGAIEATRGNVVLNGTVEANSVKAGENLTVNNVSVVEAAEAKAIAGASLSAGSITATEADINLANAVATAGDIKAAGEIKITNASATGDINAGKYMNIQNITAAANVKGGADVNLDNAAVTGAIEAAGNLALNGVVTADSVTAGEILYVAGDVKAEAEVTAKGINDAVKGSVSAAAITATAYDILLNNATATKGDISAEGQVQINNASAAGNINAGAYMYLGNATAQNINGSADVVIDNAKVDEMLKAEGNMALNGEVSAETVKVAEALYVNGNATVNAGTVNAGDVTLAENAFVDATVVEVASINALGPVAGTVNADTLTSSEGNLNVAKVTANAVNGAADINFNAAEVFGDVKAAGAVSIADGIVRGNINAGTFVGLGADVTGSVTVTKGDINIGNANVGEGITAYEGDVTVTALSDEVTVGNITADGDVTLNAADDAAVLTAGIITACAVEDDPETLENETKAGNVTINGVGKVTTSRIDADGSVAVTGNLTTLDAHSITAKNGDVTVNAGVADIGGDVIAEKGSIIVADGELIADGKVEAAGKVQVQTKLEAKDVKGSVVYLQGDINAANVTATEGDVTIVANLADGNVADVKAEGSVTLSATVNKTCTVNGNVTAEKDLTVMGAGSVVINGYIDINGTFSMTAAEMTFGQDVEFAVMNLNDQTVTFKAAAEIGTLNAEGSVTVNTLGTGAYNFNAIKVADNSYLALNLENNTLTGDATVGTNAIIAISEGTFDGAVTAEDATGSVILWDASVGTVNASIVGIYGKAAIKDFKADGDFSISGAVGAELETKALNIADGATATVKNIALTGEITGGAGSVLAADSVAVSGNVAVETININGAFSAADVKGNVNATGDVTAENITGDVTVAGGLIVNDTLTGNLEVTEGKAFVNNMAGAVSGEGNLIFNDIDGVNTITGNSVEVNALSKDVTANITAKNGSLAITAADAAANLNIAGDLKVTKGDLKVIDATVSGNVNVLSNTSALDGGAERNVVITLAEGYANALTFNATAKNIINVELSGATDNLNFNTVGAGIVNVSGLGSSIDIDRTFTNGDIKFNGDYVGNIDGTAAVTVAGVVYGSGLTAATVNGAALIVGAELAGITDFSEWFVNPYNPTHEAAANAYAAIQAKYANGFVYADVTADKVDVAKIFVGTVTDATEVTFGKDAFVEFDSVTEVAPGTGMDAAWATVPVEKVLVDAADAVVVANGDVYGSVEYFTNMDYQEGHEARENVIITNGAEINAKDVTVNGEFYGTVYASGDVAMDGDIIAAYKKEYSGKWPTEPAVATPVYGKTTIYAGTFTNSNADTYILADIEADGEGLAVKTAAKVWGDVTAWNGSVEVKDVEGDVYAEVNATVVGTVEGVNGIVANIGDVDLTGKAASVTAGANASVRAGSVVAGDVTAGEIVKVRDAEIGGDVWAGTDADIVGTVKGDVIADANAYVTGTVNGEVIAAENATVNGNVVGGVTATAGLAKVDGIVIGDVTGASVELKGEVGAYVALPWPLSPIVIASNVTATDGDATVDGTVYGNVTAVNGTANVLGEVKGDVTAQAVNVGSETEAAVIGGSVEATAADATVYGAVTGDVTAAGKAFVKGSAVNVTGATVEAYGEFTGAVEATAGDVYVEGTVGDVSALAGSATVIGNVNGGIQANNDVTVTGTVAYDILTGATATLGGNVGGSVEANAVVIGEGATIAEIGGDVIANSIKLEGVAVAGVYAGDAVEYDAETVVVGNINGNLEYYGEKAGNVITAADFAAGDMLVGIRPDYDNIVSELVVEAKFNSVNANNIDFDGKIHTYENGEFETITVTPELKITVAADFAANSLNLTSGNMTITAANAAVTNSVGGNGNIEITAEGGNITLGGNALVGDLVLNAKAVEFTGDVTLNQGDKVNAESFTGTKVTFEGDSKLSAFFNGVTEFSADTIIATDTLDIDLALNLAQTLKFDGDVIVSEAITGAAINLTKDGATFTGKAAVAEVIFNANGTVAEINGGKVSGSDNVNNVVFQAATDEAAMIAGDILLAKGADTLTFASAATCGVLDGGDGSDILNLNAAVTANGVNDFETIAFGADGSLNVTGTGTTPDFSAVAIEFAQSGDNGAAAITGATFSTLEDGVSTVKVNGADWTWSATDSAFVLNADNKLAYNADDKTLTWTIA